MSIFVMMPGLGAVLLLVAGADAGAAAMPACISVSTDARYVPYGYDHVVILRSGCSKPARCTVSTDVNPHPIEVAVAASRTVEVVTFKASPSRTFVPRVTCAVQR